MGRRGFREKQSCWGKIVRFRINAGNQELLNSHQFHQEMAGGSNFHVRASRVVNELICIRYFLYNF